MNYGDLKPKNHEFADGIQYYYTLKPLKYKIIDFDILSSHFELIQKIQEKYVKRSIIPCYVMTKIPIVKARKLIKKEILRIARKRNVKMFWRVTK